MLERSNTKQSIVAENKYYIFDCSTMDRWKFVWVWERGEVVCQKSANSAMVTVECTAQDNPAEQARPSFLQISFCRA